MTYRNKTPRWQPGRGREQLEALRELYRNSDSTASQSTNTARPSVGDIVHVPGIGRCHVVRTDNPSLLSVQNAQGVEFKVGERAVERLEVRQ